ncbi:DNA glycosylase/AP lyase ROS1-like [Camellia sinensis]|uniref:DNA glycosylase/AP lyase ROS1-like n=1 Tax=Camellia sinensis TaxID=4442 RepID=UPI001035A06A|nr:DNA glycosylase/AP lyase ROS1-like [Camellia sinensis]
MPLPPADNSEPKDMQLVMRKYEPIVEEPTTPKPETTEVTKSDIEDAFYEDPDDKLNIEQFTQNLQNYMQENMELHVGDMSASITTPKLKNVSRLRTEHQVYKFPDSHPLLKGVSYLYFCSVSICKQLEKNVRTYVSTRMNFI